MILLGSFLHHEELADIIGRVLEDRMRPEDAARLKLLLNLNSYVVRLYSRMFAQRVFQMLHGSAVLNHPARTKGELKDVIVAHPPNTNPRIQELVSRYRRFPEDYYRETPYEGRFFTTGDPPSYAGSCRIKRIRRIAEKCARRIIDYMLEQIRRRADELAIERAHRHGIHKDQLITPPEEMTAEFEHAERRVLKSIRDGLFVAAMPQFYIDDCVGIRIITTPATAPRVAEWFASSSDLSIVDEKHFSGAFNGSNMVVAWRYPKEELLANPPNDFAVDVLLARNVIANRSEAVTVYEAMIQSDPGFVRFEILTVDYEQLLESEIGRSMHEEHIRSQRENAAYGGRLAQNVEALMIYLFAYAQSSNAELPEMPIKLRGTYLPDYLASLLRDLYAPNAAHMGLTF